MLLNKQKAGVRFLLAVALAGLGVLLTASTSTTSAAAAAKSEPAFCHAETLHDYLAPLKRMPKLRELPYRARGEIRFRGAYIGASGPSLAISGGSAGYQLQWEGNTNWDITVTFARVNWRGKVVQRLGRRHFRLGKLAPVVITEPHILLPGKPATYRTTLVIRSHSGRKLAEFGNYYRVIRPTVHNRLVTDAGAYRPGGTLFARLEDPGATIVLFGEEFFVEKLEGEDWARISETPFPAPLQFVAAGTTSNHCIVFPIPTTMPTGRYRLSQEAVISWASLDGQIRPTLHAEFEVAP
jgi:hypothetical protein